MNLLTCQHLFIDHVLEDDAPLPLAWVNDRMRTGLAIYRKGYRSRLIDALAETFPHTRQWVGDESFDKAAAHHLINNPPSHWSLDRAGAGFPESLEVLFARDPEVPELAALEWDMHLAFVAPDAQPLDANAFASATASFGDENWERLRFTLHPTLTVRSIRTSAAAIWRALAEERTLSDGFLLDEPGHILVWRDGMVPVFRTSADHEADCLGLLRAGCNFGDLCLHLTKIAPCNAAAVAGGLLADWLTDGLIVGLH
ncbi:hypothetical protein GRI58_12945 [Porphyrobacter algicida]|uniref:Putative DNA-binding domain-containing protein n=1 Tax=Qipengyuania algicida TaxID=1836209 RepID=A0A845AMH3_9SPHN|nr:DNA-binding domain-containing protein [Qipengyuania algicida]MXP29716.1 hypothetical protein [Qipengyuania algicida]